MLTCSSCHAHSGILRIFCTNFYEFFFNFRKFVKIRDFFAEVTNSRSMACISAGDIRSGDCPEVDGALLGVLEQQLEPRRLHRHAPLRHPRNSAIQQLCQFTAVFMYFTLGSYSFDCLRHRRKSRRHVPLSPPFHP